MTIKDNDVVSKIDSLVESSPKTRRNSPSMGSGAGGYDGKYSALQDMTQGPLEMASARASVPIGTVRSYLRSRRGGKTRSKASIDSGIRVSQGRDIEQSLTGAGYDPLSDDSFTLDEPTPEGVTEAILSMSIKDHESLRELAGSIFQLSEMAKTDSEAVTIGQKLKEDIDKACVDILDGHMEPSLVEGVKMPTPVLLDEDAGFEFVDAMLENYTPDDSSDVAHALTAIIEGSFDEGLMEGNVIKFTDDITQGHGPQDRALAYGEDKDGHSIVIAIKEDDGTYQVMMEHLHNKKRVMAMGRGSQLIELAQSILKGTPSLFDNTTSDDSEGSEV